MTDEPKIKIKLEVVKDVLEAQVLSGDDLLSVEIETIFGSDLMSDVLSFVKENSLLLSGLVNQHVVRTAEMAGIAAVCIVRGKKAHPETVKLASEKKIPLLATTLSMYESCGRLHKKGLRGGYEAK